jgi:L-ascorbate metabolism protein UlaG (beta-lactamase superfamily)
LALYIRKAKNKTVFLHESSFAIIIVDVIMFHSDKFLQKPLLTSKKEMKMKSVKHIFMAILLTEAIMVYSEESPNTGAPAGKVEKQAGTDVNDPNTTISQLGFEVDTIKTKAGDLKITFIGHATLMFDFAGKIIHVDPVSREADYSKLPKADLILVTHEHGDHLDAKAINLLKKDATQVVLTKTCAQQVSGGTVMQNGDTKTIGDLKIEAVPAYNLEKAFHPRGQGNGYVITFGDKRVYIGGDTENIPEMKNLKDIYIAFLPMNLPYTMTPEMVADAAKVFKPKILYPYHYGQTDTSKIVDLLKDSGIKVLIRKMP